MKRSMLGRSLRSVHAAASKVMWASVRILLFFSFINFGIDSTVRLAAQFTPANFFFEISRVLIEPSGKVVIVYRQSFSGDLAVGVSTELIGDDDLQSCAGGGRRLIEAGTLKAIVPVARLLSQCDWGEVPDGVYRLQITASYPAGGTFDKTITRRSDNALIVRSGRIVGATPASETGPD